MLTQIQAQKMAIEHQTIVDNILKEHYQLYLLDILYKSSFEENLVFKGGTALRLAYQSYRFSEDLDFSIQGNIAYTEFEKAMKSVVNILPEARIIDMHDKRYTLYAKIVFRIDFKPIPIGIKVEINQDANDFEEQIVLLKSPFNNLEVLGRVYTLESILKDKEEIIQNRTRRAPRDLFDIWIICQKLNRECIIQDQDKYTKKELMDGLNPLLPAKFKKVMPLFEK
ncbi:MAG: nucleotidyl transferase AbiEii/AbiGii toxin family protein [Caldisericia bacterium]|nr:nucleotidyl transferase AbiEii/AbiGii toxin family protein [Caldisericia bacterium]